MYLSENRQADAVSISFYYKRLKRMNLKFHRPQKDLCEICENYHRSNETEKQTLHNDYAQHISEKDSIRNMKRDIKERTVAEEKIAFFDLQQVMLPHSNRGELFYKRRMSCYNFTVYDVKKHHADCFPWNESIAKRGANEISSYLSEYITQTDKEKK